MSYTVKLSPKQYHFVFRAHTYAENVQKMENALAYLVNLKI